MAYKLSDVQAYGQPTTGQPITVDFATQGRVDAQPRAVVPPAEDDIEPTPPSDEIDPPAGTGLIDAMLGQVKSGLSTQWELTKGLAKSVPRAGLGLLQGYDRFGPEAMARHLVEGVTGRPVPDNPYLDKVRRAIGRPAAHKSLSDLIVDEPPKPYGIFDDYLQYANTEQQVGGIVGDVGMSMLLPGSRVATATRFPRLASAAREGAVGALMGQATAGDPITGAVTGGVTGAMFPSRTASELAEAAEKQLAKAKQRVSQAVAPSTKANKRFVDKNWEQIITTSPWFGGLQKLHDTAEAAARVAGQRIDAVLTGVRQGNVAPQLKAARVALQQGANALLTKAGQVGIQLAPKTRESLEAIAQGLASVNPKSTSLQVLQAARDELTATMRGLRGELGRRSRQIQGVGAVRQAFDAAISGGTVQATRNLSRAAQRRLRSVQQAVAPSRIQTRPILSSLASLRRTFTGVNDAGEEIIHNVAGAQQVDDLIAQVRAYGGEMNIDQTRNIRQQWDNIVAGAGGKGFLSDIADESRRGAHRSGANILRGSIAQQVPDLVAPNRAFSFNRGLGDVVQDTIERRAGQTKGPMAGVAAVGGTVGGGVISALMDLSLPGAGLATATGGALLHYGTKLLKSPEFNLLSAKVRLATAQALRRGDIEALRSVLGRVGTQLRISQASGGMNVDTPGDMTDEEYQEQLQELGITGTNLPGISDPDSNVDDIVTPLPPNVAEPLDGDGLDPALMGGDTPLAEEGSPEASARRDPDVLRADAGGGLVRRAADFVNRHDQPLIDLPEWEGHPNVNKATAALEQFTRPSDLTFLASSVARPLLAGTRFARGAETVGRVASGVEALQGAAALDEGLDTRNPAKIVGGGMGLLLGGAGMKEGGPATAATSIGRRLLKAGGAGGVNVVAGPALALSAQELADSSAMRRLIPDDEMRATAASGLQILALGGSTVAFGAMAYKQMPPTRKALVHLAGDISEGRSAAISRQRLTPMLTSHFKQRYPAWTPERIAEKVTSTLDAAEAQARELVAKVDRDSGGRALDVRRTERMIDTDQALQGGWYDGARGMVESHVPAAPGAATVAGTAVTDAAGNIVRPALTEKQYFALEALAAFGTNTPPADNFALYKRVADAVKTAPDDLTRPQLMEWLRTRMIGMESVTPKGGRKAREQMRVFGMNERKPGIPALRALMEGTKETLGGRKIESYFHNLAQVQRNDAIGRMIDPTTNDRWVLRGMGLPTEIPLRTDEPVLRRTPSGAPVIDPATGQPLQRGGDRRVRQVSVVDVDPERVAQIEERLLAQATKRAEARGVEITPADEARIAREAQALAEKAQQQRVDQTQQRLMAEATKRAEARGTPITPREVARIEREARVLTQQFAKPTVRQAHRSTAQGSEYVSNKLIADVGYEVTERNLMEAAKRTGMSPIAAQATLWFRQKFGSDLFGGKKSAQGLPLDQQEHLAAAGTARLDPYLADVPTEERVGRRTVVIPHAERVERAEKLLTARDSALAKEVTDSIEANGGATFALGGEGRAGTDVTAVSIFPERQLMVPRAAKSAEDGWIPAVVAFMQDNADLLRNPDFAIGGWVAPALTPAERRAGKTAVKFAGREVPPNTLVLDVVATPSRGHNNLVAKTLGMEFNQYSVYDLLQFQEQGTGGMSWLAGSPAARNAAAARRPHVYERGTVLDPNQIAARIAALEADPRLSDKQRVMLKWWKRQRDRQQRPGAAAAAATGTEGDLGGGLLRHPDGKPITVHHGSTARDIVVTDLDPARPNVRPVSGVRGVSFTTDAHAASGYTRPPRSSIKVPPGRVLSANLVMHHPLDITDTVAKLRKRGMSFGDAKREALKALTPEHDGVIFRGDKMNPDEYQVFSRDQIRPVSE